MGGAGTGDGERVETVVRGGAPREREGGLYAELLGMSRSHGGGEDVPEEPTEPTRRIDFDHLQFGKDYEIR